MAKIIVLIIAGWFAIGWTICCALWPYQRIKSDFITVLYWDIAFILSIFDVINFYHLIWFMPVALFIPMVTLQVIFASNIRPISTITIFMVSSIFLAPIIFFLT